MNWLDEFEPVCVVLFSIRDQMCSVLAVIGQNEKFWIERMFHCAKKIRLDLKIGKQFIKNNSLMLPHRTCMAHV